MLRLQDEVAELTKMLSNVTQELNKTQEEREELKLMNMVEHYFAAFGIY